MQVERVEQVVPSQRNTDEPGPVVSVPELLEAGGRLHVALEAGVQRLRMLGHSWGVVGSALGVSRQSAHERWRYLDDAPVAIVVGAHSVWARCQVTGVEVPLEETPPAQSLTAGSLRSLAARCEVDRLREAGRAVASDEGRVAASGPPATRV